MGRMITPGLEFINKADVLRRCFYLLINVRYFKPIQDCIVVDTEVGEIFTLSTAIFSVSLFRGRTNHVQSRGEGRYTNYSALCPHTS